MFPRTPVVVVDFGTATNFDVVDEEGSYCGGAIAPGPNLSIEALVAAAALLPRIVVEKPEKVIGTTTVACMHTGVFWGYVGLIEGIVTRIKAEFGKPMKVVSTGGLAPVFEGYISVIDQVATRHHGARADRDLEAQQEGGMTVPGNDELLFLALGGAGEIGMNLNLYGHAGKWLMIDLGIGFADDTMPGVEVVMPDPGLHRGTPRRPFGHRADPRPRGPSRRRRRPLAAAEGAGLCHAVRGLGAAPQAAARRACWTRCRSPRSRWAASSACRRSSSS